VLVVQSTSENAAKRIAKNGFGIVASLDKGWYGQGIYTTSKIRYARTYDLTYKSGTYVISLAIPGNTFPITDWTREERVKSMADVSKTHSHLSKSDSLYKKSDSMQTKKSDSSQPKIPFEGKPCRPGYQSHYSVVSTNGLPLRPEKMEPSSYDELVLFESSQILPIFVVKSNKPLSLEDNFSKGTPPPPPALASMSSGFFSSCLFFQPFY